MYCQKCGNEIPDNSVFCDVCGERVSLQVGIQQTVQKDAKKKKRNKSTIILSVFLCLSLIGCGVLGYIAIRKANLVAFKSEVIKNKNNSIDYYENEVDLLRERAEFLDNYVVIVGDNGSKYYHKYECGLWRSCDSILVYNEEAARQDGYKPCSICCK